MSKKFTSIAPLLFFIILSFQSFSQEKNTYISNNKNYSVYKTVETFPTTEFQEKRFALVIAVSNYASIPTLANDANDADSMTSILNKAGFDVMKVNSSPTKDEFNEIINASKNYYIDNDYNIALFYFSGHGANLGSTQMLLPSDFPPSIVSGDINDSLSSKILGKFLSKSILLSNVVSSFNVNNTKKIISIIDACRSADYIINKSKSPVDNIPIEVMNVLNDDGSKMELDGKHSIFLPVGSGETTPSTSPNFKNSFFTYYIMKSFHERPSTLSDFGKIIRKKMKDCKKKPIIKILENDYEFQFYKAVTEIPPPEPSEIDLGKNEIAILDYQLKKKENWRFSSKTLSIGDSWTEEYGNFNSILNPANFVIEGEIDYYPTIFLYFGGDENDRNNGAFCVEINGKLNNDAIFQYGNNYEITDLDNLKFSLRYGFVINGTFKIENTYTLPYSTSKDWQNIHFKLIQKNNSLRFSINQIADESINASFSVTPNFDFAQFNAKSRNIFAVKNKLDNILPDYINSRYWCARTIYINKISCTSSVSKDSQIYKKTNPSFENRKIVTDYFQNLKENNKSSYIKQEASLLIDGRCKLIPELKIIPTDNLFIEFENSVQKSQDYGNYFNPDYVSCLSIKFNKEDLITSSKNGESFANKNNFNFNKNENAIYIPLNRYKNFKVLFSEKSVLFFDNDVFQGSIDFEYQLAPITIEAFNRKDCKIKFKKLSLNVLKK